MVARNQSRQNEYQIGDSFYNAITGRTTTEVKGEFVAGITHESANVSSFLADEVRRLSNERLQSGVDFPLPNSKVDNDAGRNASWTGFSSQITPTSACRLGLRIDPVQGQSLKYGILTAAIQALIVPSSSQGMEESANKGSVASANKAITFDVIYGALFKDGKQVEGAKGVLIAKGVLTECEGSDSSCFKHFAM